MLLDPLEELCHLAAVLVELADGGCRQRKVVGEKHQCLAGLEFFEADAAQMLRIVMSGIEAIECDGLVADDAGAAIGLAGIDPMRVEVRLGARDEETARLM